MKSIATFLTIAFISFSFNYSAQSLNFDGINDYVITSAAGPIGTSNRTVECWIKTSNSINSQQVLIDWGDMSPNGSRFTLNLINNGRLRIEVGGNGINSTAQIANGMWHHVAVTYDHSATTKIRLYIDGVQDISGNFTVAVNTTATNPIQFGRRNDGVNHYQGEMDEVRIWNFAKTAAQILTDMNTEFCTSQIGLVAYFQLNDGTPFGVNGTSTSASDFVTPANNGVLTNFALAGRNSNWVAGTSSIAKPLNDTIIQVGSTIVALESSANTYSWVDCNSATPLTANSSQTYAPTVNGDYKVALQKGICIDTSACLNFLSVGIDQTELNFDLKGFPNPAQNDYTVSIPEQIQQQSGELKLYTMNGALVMQEQVNSFSNELSVNLSDFENGLYYIQLVTQKHNLVGKVVIEK